MLTELLIMKLKGKKILEKGNNCVFIKINPDEKDFSIFKEINKICRHITQSKKRKQNKRTKKTK